MDNKRGNIMAIIMIFVVLFLVLFIGIGIAFLGLTIDWVFDEAVPELSGLGNVGSVNLNETASYTLAPVNSVVQNFSWLGGVLYAMALIGCVGVAFVFRFTGNKWMLSLFFLFIIILLMASIFISNIYEEFYDGQGEVGSRLHEYTLLSWLILYSPMVMVIIGFICGIIMFSGEGVEESIA